MLLRLLISWVLLTAPAIAGDLIAITRTANQKTIEVEPQSVTSSAVSFEIRGKAFTIPLDQLTEDSRQRLQQWQNDQSGKQAALTDKINDAIGTPLFKTGASLWAEPAADVGQRLGWRQESSAKGAPSFRSYPKADARFIRARPYCCTLYGGKDDTCDSLSVVFANKGDFNSKVGSGEDHFKETRSGNDQALSLNDAIQQDIDAISAALTEVLGPPSDQRYGEKEDRRNALRWDFENHAFILSNRKDEYAHLLVVDRHTADEEGKVEFIKDQDLRERLAANVSRKDNGDVVIEGIPMVNQGPKGYCAPATFERAMRYMRVPADMYLLATLATMPGGGTNTMALASEAKRIISSKARRIKDLQLESDLDVRLVARYIDKGVPILWQMASLSDYNKAANQLTKDRKEVTDMTEWAQQLEARSGQVVPMLHNTDNYHICMIIGYNEATSEIAVSDSWGPGYALRWVPIDVAKAVTTRGGFVIDL